MSVSPRARRVAQAAFDFACWLLAAPLAVTCRFDFAPSLAGLGAAALLGAVMSAFQVVAGLALYPHRGRYKFGSFDEVLGVITSVLLVGDGSVPRSNPLLAVAFAGVAILAGRVLVRAWRQRVKVQHTDEPTIVLGPGEAGDQLVKAMLLDSNSAYDLGALLDDDPGKRRLRLHGFLVRGTSQDLAKVATDYGARVLVVAIATADAPQLLAWEPEARAADMQLGVLPSTQDIVAGAVKLGDVSQVTEDDLVGRRPINTDDGGIGQMLFGRRMLITGAGGSIGAELARQVHRYEPAYLGLLDRDESALHLVQMSIYGNAMLDSDDILLADICDPQRLHAVIEHVRPDVVLHAAVLKHMPLAAVLKHMPLLEQAPHEVFKTNT